MKITFPFIYFLLSIIFIICDITFFKLPYIIKLLILFLFIISALIYRIKKEGQKK